MKRSRLFGFIIAIVIGLFAGLFYGWMVNPSEVSNTTLDSMRGDFRADYVLMVAESFSVDQNLQTAVSMLVPVSPLNPSKAVKEALITGQQLNYSIQEMQVLAVLEIAMNTNSASVIQETP
ncbi:MAG: hypothetical protein NTZ74_10565 [Chloroflexi bacterium]|nr:hypothetical protein [Chloroflexota bacterium]